MGHKHNNNNQQRNPMTNMKTMGQDGFKVLKDLAFGNTAVLKNPAVTERFRNPNYVYATIEEIGKRITEAKYVHDALCIAYPNSQDPTIQKMIIHYGKRATGYEIMWKTLNNIIIGNFLDIGFLYTIPMNMTPYKYNI